MTRPEIVTLCGSLRIFPLILQVAADETAAGRMVLSPFKTGVTDSEALKRLDELHRRKIDMADRVIVVTDRSGRIGESTRGEIEYATRVGKPVVTVMVEQVQP
ncbi:hypothetical protein [Micromonospora sp. NPDC048169]|uniref:hypothetical protein n=1 Tax=Micromonospora sp. NPDC048169 TaxID=3154711 RepID=UPI0033D434CE